MMELAREVTHGVTDLHRDTFNADLSQESMATVADLISSRAIDISISSA